MSSTDQGGGALLDNARNCRLHAKGALARAGQTTALNLLDVGTPPGPTTQSCTNGDFSVQANRPELAAFFARILSLQSADWIGRGRCGVFVSAWKIDFPTTRAGLGRDSVRMLGQCDGKPSISRCLDHSGGKCETGDTHAVREPAIDSSFNQIGGEVR